MNALFAYLLKSGACLAVFYGIYRLALMKDTNFVLNRTFLLGSAALSLTLPLVHVPSPFFTTVVRVSAASLPEIPPAGPASAAAPAIGLSDVLAAVYAAGAGLFLLLFLVRIGRLALMAARCGCERNRGLRIVLCGRAGESFSFFNFVFLNGAGIDPEDRDRILAHELAHVRQLHSLDILVAEILTVIQWFNPFVWPYRRSLRETHEYLADRAVIAQGCGLARYQLLIVEQHVGGRLLELASGLRTSQIKRRIVMLSRQETKGLARWKPLLILPLAVVFVLAFAESRTVVVRAQEAVQAKSPEHAKEAEPAHAASEEEMAQALKEKWAKLVQMKEENAKKLEALKAKLDETTDAAVKEKILAKMQEHKLLFLEIAAKMNMLQMKKIEMALAKETDPAKKEELGKKIEDLKAQTDEYKKKLEVAHKADIGVEKKETEKK